MKKTHTLLMATLVIAGWSLADAAIAANWFGGGDSSQQNASAYDPYATPYRTIEPVKKPNFFQKADTDIKNFFAQTGRLLNLSQPPAPKVQQPTNPWVRPPKDPRYLRSTEVKQASWLAPIFGGGQKEPEPEVRTMSDFVGLPRPGH